MGLNKSAVASNLGHKLFKMIASSTVKLAADSCHLSFFIAKNSIITVNDDIFQWGGTKENAFCSSAIKKPGAGSAFYSINRVLM